ncbi:MAG: hypothetical protein IJ668_08690, partial [Selenomonadaceae bacterium]|nr:hypothetical protein [Selenomonadaceae bacterium]
METLNKFSFDIQLFADATASVTAGSTTGTWNIGLGNVSGTVDSVNTSAGTVTVKVKVANLKGALTNSALGGDVSNGDIASENASSATGESSSTGTSSATGESSSTGTSSATGESSSTGTSS